MRQTVAQKLRSFKYAAATTFAVGAMKMASDWEKSSKIPDSALQEATKRLKQTDSFDRQTDSRHTTKNTASKTRSHD